MVANENKHYSLAISQLEQVNNGGEACIRQLSRHCKNIYHDAHSTLDSHDPLSAHTLVTIKNLAYPLVEIDIHPFSKLSRQSDGVFYA